MAKRFLEGFSISGDVIDQVAGRNGTGSSPHPNSVDRDRSAESPPVGASGTNEPSAKGAGSQASPAFWVREGVYCYECDGRRYEVRGIESGSQVMMRVQLRLSWQGRRQFDGLDLVSSRARRAFAAEVERVWGIEADSIEADLRELVDRIEREREKAPRKAAALEPVQLSESDREAGIALLASPDLIDQIADDIERLGYVGERMNSLLVYLCATSRKLSSPLSVIIVSESASGKSYLVETVRKLIPPADVVAVTSLSDQALNYFDDLEHKFLILGEAVHSEVVEHQLREMLSAKELRRLVTVKDPETGRMVSRMVSKPVLVSSVMSGTNYRLNAENASRCFLIGTDESDEQTRRIHEAQRRRYTLSEMKRREREVPVTIARHRAAQSLLEPVRVVNPLAPYLDFPSHQMRLRRDHERFLDLMASVAFLRQKQKEKHTEGAFSYVEVDLTDYRIAWEIMVGGVLSRSLGALPTSADRLLEAIRRYVTERARTRREEPVEVSFTQRVIREVTGASQSWVKQNLRTLVEYEYVDVVRGGSARSRGYYRIAGPRPSRQPTSGTIPTPQAIEKLLS